MSPGLGFSQGIPYPLDVGLNRAFIADGQAEDVVAPEPGVRKKGLAAPIDPLEDALVLRVAPSSTETDE